MLPMIAYSTFTIDDYEAAFALWQATPGVGIGPTDDRANIDSYLKRNPNLSLKATCDDALIGTLLAGHDGRRGYLYHLCVDESHRGQGIAVTLLDKALAGLTQEGIGKTTLFVYKDNTSGQSFWRHQGWYDREDLHVMQVDLGSPIGAIS